MDQRTSAAFTHGELAWGPLRVDLVRGFANLGEVEVAMQPLQLRILAFLLMRAECIVTCEDLRRNVFRVAQAPGSTSIARQICVLRSQLGPFAGLLTTEPGGYAIGYRRLTAETAVPS